MLCAFAKGEEARHIWEWLEMRDALDRLAPALDEIDRTDLSAMLRAENQ